MVKFVPKGVTELLVSSQQRKFHGILEDMELLTGGYVFGTLTAHPNNGNTFKTYVYTFGGFDIHVVPHMVNYDIDSLLRESFIQLHGKPSAVFTRHDVHFVVYGHSEGEVQQGIELVFKRGTYRSRSLPSYLLQNPLDDFDDDLPF